MADELKGFFVNKSIVLIVTIFCMVVAQAQERKRSHRKGPGTEKPVCSPGAICFSGEALAGQEFRKTLTEELEFVLEPGWMITIVPKHPQGECRDFASVVNAPYHAHRDLYINTSYGWTAEQEVTASPRQFYFVKNCTDYGIESKRLSVALRGNGVTKQQYDEAVAKLATSPLGRGRFWITDSKTTHVEDTLDHKTGTILWIKFTVEIRLS